MWITKKRLQKLEKRMTVLEKRVQDQPKEIIKIISQQIENELNETIQQLHY